MESLWTLAGILLAFLLGRGLAAGIRRARGKPGEDEPHCPYCGETYRPGQDACVSCQSRLPDAVAARMLVKEGETYDLQCPGCRTPYRLGDYRPDAERIFCSFCGAELNRDRWIVQ